jgi:hypothetical protein
MAAWEIRQLGKARSLYVVARRLSVVDVDPAELALSVGEGDLGVDAQEEAGGGIAGEVALVGVEPGEDALVGDGEDLAGDLAGGVVEDDAGVGAEVVEPAADGALAQALKGVDGVGDLSRRASGAYVSKPTYASCWRVREISMNPPRAG